MTLEGSTQDLGIPEVFQLIVLQQREGVLTVRTKETPVWSVQFKKGQVLCGSEGNPEEALGNRLVHTGKLTIDQLNIALKAQKNKPLPIVLSKLGYVSPGEIRKAFIEITKETISRLLEVKNGSYQFESQEVFFDANFIEPLTLSEDLTDRSDPSGEPSLEPLKSVTDGGEDTGSGSKTVSLKPMSRTFGQQLFRMGVNGLVICVSLIGLLSLSPAISSFSMGIRQTFEKIISLAVWKEKEEVEVALHLYYLRHHRYPAALSDLVQEDLLIRKMEVRNLEKWIYTRRQDGFSLELK